MQLKDEYVRRDKAQDVLEWRILLYSRDSSYVRFYKSCCTFWLSSYSLSNGKEQGLYPVILACFIIPRPKNYGRNSLWYTCDFFGFARAKYRLDKKRRLTRKEVKTYAIKPNEEARRDPSVLKEPDDDFFYEIAGDVMDLFWEYRILHDFKENLLKEGNDPVMTRYLKKKLLSAYRFIVNKVQKHLPLPYTLGYLRCPKIVPFQPDSADLISLCLVLSQSL